MSITNEKGKSDVVRLLLNLYGMVIALALTAAIGLTVAPDGIAINPFVLNARNVALFGAFFVTIVPFYHGASMFMLRTYKHGFASSKKGAPLVDFFILTVEGVIFYAIAASIQNLESFIIWFSSLFVLDIVWVSFTYFKSTGEEEAPIWWAILNGGMVLFLITISGIRVELWLEVYYLIFAVAVVRTCLDYAKCYPFYFPPDKQKLPEKPKNVNT
jgi:hypothetical protein